MRKVCWPEFSTGVVALVRRHVQEPLHGLPMHEDDWDVRCSGWVDRFRAERFPDVAIPLWIGAVKAYRRLLEKFSEKVDDQEQHEIWKLLELMVSISTERIGRLIDVGDLRDFPEIYGFLVAYDMVAAMEAGIALNPGYLVDVVHMFHRSIGWDPDEMVSISNELEKALYDTTGQRPEEWRKQFEDV